MHVSEATELMLSPHIDSSGQNYWHSATDSLRAVGNVDTSAGLRVSAMCNNVVRRE